MRAGQGQARPRGRRAAQDSGRPRKPLQPMLQLRTLGNAAPIGLHRPARQKPSMLKRTIEGKQLRDNAAIAKNRERKALLQEGLRRGYSSFPFKQEERHGPSPMTRGTGPGLEYPENLAGWRPPEVPCNDPADPSLQREFLARRAELNRDPNRMRPQDGPEAIFRVG